MLRRGLFYIRILAQRRKMWECPENNINYTYYKDFKYIFVVIIKKDQPYNSTINIFFISEQRAVGDVDISETKQRIIQEYVPGKQITLAHLIASPDRSLYHKLGLEKTGAIGIMTITPSEGAIIAADIATKAAGVEIGFLDRFSGSLVITGDVASVEASLKQVINVLKEVLKFSPAPITRS